MSLESFSDGMLSSVAHSLGDAGGPLVGRVLSDILAACNIPNKSGESTKWKFLYQSLREVQRSDRCANRIGVFLESALDPARWSSDANRELYEPARSDINRAILTAGLEIGSDGKLRSVAKAKSLDEAHERANRLRALLEKRDVHVLILVACAKLILKDGNYFHAVLEVTKTIAARLRGLSGLSLDGVALLDQTLESGARPFPLIALNRYDSSSLVNEQKGVANLARGLFQAFRNVTAHEQEVSWPVSEQDALDMISTASLIHRRLDHAINTSQYQPI